MKERNQGIQMNQASNITAFILAGGKSSRMGTDKGLVSFRGKEMIKWPIDLLQTIFKNVFIVANRSGYAKFELPVIEDLLHEKGPIGGLYTALTTSNTNWNFIMACDMPFMNSQVINKLISDCDLHDAVVPYYNNKPEPLAACYNKSCLTLIEKQLESGNFKMQDFISELNIKRIDFSSENISVNHPFRNLNTMDELNNVSSL